MEPETARTLAQFKNGKPAVGLKPLISFSGTAFESPVENEYTLAKQMLLELFKGPDVANVDVEGLQYMLCFSVEEEVEGQPKPVVRMRAYLIRTKKTGGTVPRVETEEMGPRVDFRLGRMKQADPEMMKEALRKPKSQEVRIPCAAPHCVQKLTLLLYSPRRRRTSRRMLLVTRLAEFTWASRAWTTCRPGR